MKNPITLNFLGDIAAGKGTQAKIFAKKYGLKIVSTGDFSRKIWHRVRQIREGKLTPNALMKDFLIKELSKLPSSRGVLVDGGKMPSEAMLINRIFKKQKRKFIVLYLTIPKNEIFERLKVRIQKEKRHDDSPQAIKNRFDYYKKIYSKTVKYWKSKGVLKIISGNQPVGKVASDIEKIIKNYFK